MKLFETVSVAGKVLPLEEVRLFSDLGPGITLDSLDDEAKRSILRQGEESMARRTSGGPFALFHVLAGEGEADGGAGNIPQLMHHVGHVGHEIVVIAFAGVALRAEQLMGTKYDAHAFSPGMRFRRFRPMAQARTALMMAVGMKGRTQAVIPTAMVLWATTTNIATPTT